jgi:guanylate kinase
MTNSLMTSQPAAPGMLFVVSSPSGGGKGTLIQRMLSLVPNLGYSVSYTTRAPRDGEVHGREYFFVTRKEFEEMIAAEEFLEFACVHGNLYGTTLKQVLQETCAGRDIVLEVDVQGAASIRRLRLDSVSVFILPPSYEILRQRLIARGTDSPEELRLRLRNAPEELKEYSKFDYVIINDDAERAGAQLAAIILAEQARCKRQESVVDDVLNEFRAAQDQ